MSMEFIRRTYGVPAHRGGRVRTINVDVGEVMQHYLDGMDAGD